jgi:type IV secretory pathway TraG/TraD family ATPase VirD4
MPGLNAMPQSSPGSSVDGQDTTPLIAKERQVSLAVLPMLQAAPAPTLIAEASRHDDANAMLETQGRAPLAENPVDSHVRYFARAELENLSADQLYIARNEIFARKGRYFRDDKLKSHFEKRQWYRPSAWDVPLSPVEQANVALIQSLETPAAARSGVSRSVPIKKSMAKDSTLEDSSRQRLAREELQGLSASQLLIARNEIFARRGRYFKDEALRDYFSQFSWYQPSAWDVALSPVEQANVELIQSVEQSSASRHASSPGRVRRCEGTVC